jgi:ATP-binding cassette subfamily C protein CydC
MRLALAALLGAVTDLAGLGLLAAATWLIVTAAGQPPLAVLTVAIVAVRALALGRGAGRYLERLTGHDAALRVLVRLRTRAYAAVAAHRERTGDVLSRLVSDVDGVQELLLRCAVPVATSTLVAAAALTGVGLVDGRAAGVLAVSLVAAGIAGPLLGYRLSERTGRRLAAARADVATAAVDLARGAPDLLAYGAAGGALARAGRHADTVARLERRTATGAAALAAGTGLLPGFTALATVAVARPGGAVGAVLGVVALGAVEAMAGLSAAAPRFAEYRAGLARVRALLASPPAAVPPAAAGTVDVRLRGAVVRYRVTGPPALDGVDLDLPAGRRIAVVGPSGAGKSTLLGILAGAVPLDGGELRIGDGSAARVGGGLLSGAHVFHATILENLTLGRPDVSTEHVTAALDAAGLGEYRARLDIMVGEDGARLSGGERQRLLLARALVAPGPVLLLDEPTEGLDPGAVDSVLESVLSAVGERGVLMVTHRLAGLWRFDEILVMDAGRVAQRGDHARLSAVPGWYREAWLGRRLAEEVYAGVGSPTG